MSPIWSAYLDFSWIILSTAVKIILCVNTAKHCSQCLLITFYEGFIYEGFYLYKKVKVNMK